MKSDYVVNILKYLKLYHLSSNIIYYSQWPCMYNMDSIIAADLLFSIYYVLKDLKVAAVA